MPTRKTLILAVSKTLAGVCIAGMTTEPDPITGLRWVRPIREQGHVLLDDITTAKGIVIRPFDVVEFNLLRPCSHLPHIEDWIVDFVRHRPRVVRRLEGQQRIDFLQKYLDTAPHQVLNSQQRSLCLIKPDWIKGCFRLDSYSGKFDARLAFGLDQSAYQGSYAKGGISVTDLKWRALGRAWLPEGGGWTEFDTGDLETRFSIDQIYLAVGLAHSYKGSLGPIVVGVHTLPDYQAVVDYDNL
jgi:hypothetical protein